MGKERLARYIVELGLANKLPDIRTSFETRLELQKTIYLLEQAGAKLGYSFGWYKHGPYTSSLADDAYSLASLPTQVLQKFESPIDRDAVAKFNKLTEPLTTNRAAQLELLSCVHYVMTHSYPLAKTKKLAVDAILDLKGDRFSKTEIEKAYDALQSAGYIKE